MRPPPNLESGPNAGNRALPRTVLKTCFLCTGIAHTKRSANSTKLTRFSNKFLTAKVLGREIQNLTSISNRFPTTHRSSKLTRFSNTFLTTKVLGREIQKLTSFSNRFPTTHRDSELTRFSNTFPPTQVQRR